MTAGGWWAGSGTTATRWFWCCHWSRASPWPTRGWTPPAAAVAVEYGPLVYCLEAVDNPGHRLDDLTIDTAVAPEVVPTDGPLQGIASIRIEGRVRPRTGASWWPYRPADAPTGDKPGQSVPLTAVPYFTWGNRGPGAMRIWVPTA